MELPSGPAWLTVALDAPLNLTSSPVKVLLAAYCFFVLAYTSYCVFWPPPKLVVMGRSPLVVLHLFFLTALTLLYTQRARGQASSTSATHSRPIFTVPPEADVGQNVLANVRDPEAVDAQSVCPGYTAANVVRTTSGLTADLSLAGDACNVYGTDIDSLSLIVEYQSQDRLHVEIVPARLDDSNSSQYILSETLVRKPRVDPDAGSLTIDNDLNFVWGNEPSFYFSVLRQSTGDVLFSTEGKKLVFENQFVEFASDLPEEYNLYGLGEVIHGLRLGNNLTRTIYAADVGDFVDENIYGSHPFYLDTRYHAVDSETGSMSPVTGNQTTNASAQYTSMSHGVYLRNTHGQEVLLRAENITWRTLGGSIDLFFFAGPTQPEVTRSYQKDAIGLPVMQQYKTFGFHQCRWGYHNWSELQDIVDNFEKFEIPLEYIWLDIDYMNQYRDFDNDNNTFPYEEGQEFLQRLHDSGRYWVPIIDAAIYIPNPENNSDAYETFDRGNASDVWMRNPDGTLYIGDVWPGYTVFPDWQSEKAVEWWINEVKTWHDKIAFDGIWIDMSEVSSFCVGSCGTGNLTLQPVHPPFGLPGEPGAVVYDYPEGFNVSNATEASTAASLSSSQAAETSSSSSSGTQDVLRTTPTAGVRDINNPPYALNNYGGDLAVHAMSPNATHADGMVDYDIHNLYGHQILNATYQALLEVFPGKRPFIIGRSTFAGSGTLAGHWGGDNYSKWAYMFFSIPQALSFSLFGIPMFGADVCGFAGNTDAELCSRWMQLSAFFPFYRNHNILSADPQEPYVWSSVMDASKSAMSIRYALLPYMYTLFYQAHTTGSTVMRALAWEFPNDPALANADRQFLLGPSLLITPVLTPGATSVDGVFPGVGPNQGGEVWYDWYNQTAVSPEPGRNTTIDAPLGVIPLYVRGGSVLPMQQPALTTREARDSPWSLLAALSLEDAASGYLYIDDGESVAPNATLWVEFLATASALHATARGTYTAETHPLANVTIMGVRDANVADVSLNGDNLPNDAWSFDGEKRLLSVTRLEERTADGAWAADWVLEWR
ncbi:MAG: hypothetical protein M1833_003709 [Piccolia ochrophora]|nr:MAG: hypothetical protein M1833_003709 [Piccolia ochrophora]